MRVSIQGNAAEHRQDRLLTTLERLLEIEATQVHAALDQASQMVAEALGADKVDAFLYDPAIDSLVAMGTSDTPTGHKEKAIGMDRLPIVKGGREVTVFQTGTPYGTGHADREPGELKGFTQGLGIRSSLVVPLSVGDERRGVLLASSTRPDYFSESDLRFLEAVARWVGVVAHRTELIERIAYDAAEQGRRLAAEQLITVLAHDLRNYLTPLKGRIELILRRARREDRQKDIQDASSATTTLERLSKLVSDLLDVARLEQGLFAIEIRPVGLVALVRETAASFSTPTMAISVQAPQEIIVQADPIRLRQALANLLANAVKYSAQGAGVDIQVQMETRDRKDWATIVISDRGPGIAPEILPHLFEPFVTTSRSAGLGLGLYLASGIAAIHGGTLTVDSTPGNGARFHLSLPVEHRTA
jgi:two-component system OmpR family sensor kinase